MIVRRRIREFTSIKERLVTHRSFEISQRAYCLQLAGHRPDELFTDPVVRDLNRSYLGSLRGPGGFTIDMAANALMYDRPEGVKETEYTRRMEPFVRDLVSVEQGHAELKKFVRDRIERLKERKELMGYREERELKAALKAAAVAVRWRRGEEAASHQPERSYVHHGRSPAAGAEAGAAETRGRGAGGNQSPRYSGFKPRSRASRNGSDGAEMDPQPGVIPAVNEQSQNEPQTTQVVDPVAANRPGTPAPVVFTLTPAPYNHAAAVALVEKHQKEFDHLREYGL